jgi:hypothetical protein
MNRSETIKELSKELCNELIKILDTNLRSCINCTQFNHEGDVCSTFNARPPAKIIARGCPNWIHNAIPF